MRVSVVFGPVMSLEIAETESKKMVSTPKGKILGNLVDMERGLISRDIFTSEELYQQQLERIFARAWLFVGFASQIPIREIKKSWGPAKYKLSQLHSRRPT